MKKIDIESISSPPELPPALSPPSLPDPRPVQLSHTLDKCLDAIPKLLGETQILSFENIHALRAIL